MDRRFGIELVPRASALEDEKLVARSDHHNVELGSAPGRSRSAPRRAKRARHHQDHVDPRGGKNPMITWRSSYQKAQVPSNRSACRGGCAGRRS
jgi:hypothetical protein